MIKLSELKFAPVECSCGTCRMMCEYRPCWPTPQEARKMIDAGLAPKMMLDWWEGERYDDGTEDIYILCPAAVGFEGQRAPGGFMFSMPKLTCNLLKSGLCSIHDSGFKPIEGRMAYHDGSRGDTHEATAESWNNREAQALVLEWMKLVGYLGWQRDDLESLMALE